MTVVLRELVGHYRELLEVVRFEKEALVDADLKRIHEMTQRKEYVLEVIRQAELARITESESYFAQKRIPKEKHSLSRMVQEVQATDLKAAEELSQLAATLAILIKRIQEQNQYNQQLVVRSIVHIENMKANIMGEADQKTGTYGQKGTKQGSSVAPRFVSQEV